MLPFPKTTQALLFDCDGTLADSMPLHIQAWMDTFADYGLLCPRQFIDIRAGRPTELIVEDANLEFGCTLDPVAFVAEKEARFEKNLHLVKPIESVLSTARDHHAKLRMAVVSGGKRHIVTKTLATIAAADFFKVVITADDPVEPKPSPEIFLEAARRLQVEPRYCHVFEDGEPGIVAAVAAGMSYTDVRVLST